MTLKAKAKELHQRILVKPKKFKEVKTEQKVDRRVVTSDDAVQPLGASTPLCPEW